MHLRPKWFPLQSVLMQRFCCCCWLFFIVSPIVCGGLGFFCQCLVMLYLVYNLYFQSSRWGRESWLLYFNCLPDDFWLLVFCVSSLQCCELVCTEWLWNFPGHTHLHFGHSLFITIIINQFFCVNCLTAWQCTRTVNYFTTIIAIADLF